MFLLTHFTHFPYARFASSAGADSFQLGGVQSSKCKAQNAARIYSITKVIHHFFRPNILNSSHRR
jgi:hypothetical protein